MAALILTENLSDLGRQTLAGQVLREGWKSVVVDGDGRILVSRGEGLAPGKIIDLKHETEGHSAAVAPIDGSGAARWRVLIWGPAGVGQLTLLWTWPQFVLGSAILLVISALAAIAVGRSIHRSVHDLTNMATQVGRGEVPAARKFALTEAAEVATAIVLAAEARDEADRRLKLSLREIVYRTKNLTTVLGALIRNTRTKDGDPEELRQSLLRRIGGLAQSIDLLTAGDWNGAPFEALFDRQTSAFVIDPNRIRKDGADFIVPGHAVQAVGMILHELATNALKYGALAGGEGRIDASWRFDEERRILELRWSESGLREEPARTRGFGSTLIEGIASSLGGRATVDRSANGIVWSIDLTLENEPDEPAQ